MGRSPAYNWVKRLLLEADALNGGPSGPSSCLSRRAFLGGAGVLLGMASTAGALEAISKPGGTKVVIVGGGLSGLVTSYRLLQSGKHSEIFEATERFGGRVYTKESFNDAGMFCELGGELIDSSHKEMLVLCAELGVPLQDFRPEDAHFPTLYFSHGRLHSEAELVKGFQPLAAKLKVDSKLLNALDLMVSASASSIQMESLAVTSLKTLDRTSLAEYLLRMKVDVDAWVLDLIRHAYVSEFGLEIEEQSAINLVGFYSDAMAQFKMYGSSDECMRIEGGNSRLPAALVKKLEGKIQSHLGHQLVKIRDDGRELFLTFKTMGKTKEVRAGQVVLTIPFSVLREVEGISTLGLSPLKQKCIEELGYGTNSKVILGFKSRFWRAASERMAESPPESPIESLVNSPVSNGSIFGDFASLCFWETSRCQRGGQGILTSLLGGKDGKVVVKNIQERTLADLEKVYPKSSKYFNGKRMVMPWPILPYSKGSYSSAKVGQVTSIMPAAGEPELGGRLLFAGEHCSIGNQGYMNGAVETGNAVAQWILKKIPGPMKYLGQAQ